MPNSDIKIRVLIVDDEPDLLEICSDSFEMEGHQVECTTSAPKALELLAKNTYDVIISDSKMPEMSGEDFLAKACELMGEQMPLFFMASGAIDLDVQALKGMGMTGLIAKPFDIDDLVEEVVSSFDQKKLA